MRADWFTFFVTAVRLAAAMVALLLPAVAGAYESRWHQQLTFIAAKQFNRCAEQTDITPLTPLQVRYIAKANVSEVDSNFLRKLTRWNFYDRDGQSERSLAWVIDTRLHERFNDLVRTLDEDRPEPERYAQLGRVVSYLQDMTSPAHVVPVYFARWWRLSLSDRFNGYRPDGDALERAVTGVCDRVFDNGDPSLAQVLVDTAEGTLQAVRGPIEGLPATWEAFWTLDDAADAWGEYGPAGNRFGQRTEFRFGGERCLLLDDDPLYRGFAEARHEAAIIATLHAMRWLQLRIGGIDEVHDLATPEGDLPPSSGLRGVPPS